jgi:hypothetical protein
MPALSVTHLEQLKRLDPQIIAKLVNDFARLGDLESLSNVIEAGLVPSVPSESWCAPLAWVADDASSERREFAIRWGRAIGAGGASDEDTVREIATIALRDLMAASWGFGEEGAALGSRMLALGARSYARPIGRSASSAFEAGFKMYAQMCDEPRAQILVEMVRCEPEMMPRLRRKESIADAVLGKEVRVSSSLHGVVPLIPRLMAEVVPDSPDVVRVLEALPSSRSFGSIERFNAAAIGALYPIAVHPGSASACREFCVRTVWDIGEPLRGLLPGIKAAWEDLAVRSTHEHSALLRMCAGQVETGDLAREVMTGFFTKAREGGFDLDRPITRRGHTPLQVAAVFGSVDTVRTLLAAGANPSVPGAKKMTAAHLAHEFGNAEAFELISGYESKESLERVVARRRATRAASFLAGVGGARSDRPTRSRPARTPGGSREKAQGRPA